MFKVTGTETSGDKQDCGINSATEPVKRRDWHN